MDAIAGLTLAFFVMPESLAYASLGCANLYFCIDRVDEHHATGLVVAYANC